MKKHKLLLWGLTLLFAVFMSIPYLVPHCGFFALFGLVPLLCMDRIATLSGERRVWIYHYSGFVLWNAFTTFWVCNATIGGGLFAIFANALQMSLVFGLFRLSKKRFSNVLPYLFLMVMWIAWERFYFDAEISWPWLVLGNAFARSVASVQWYEYTGALGGSLWIWCCNLAIFGMMTALSDGSWFRSNLKAKIASVAGLVAVLAVPFIISGIMFNSYEEKENPLEVIIYQPNIDPYNKFTAMTQSMQNEILMNQIQSSVGYRRGADSLAPLLLIAPETFTNDVIVGDYQASGTYRCFSDYLKDYPGVNMLFGASSVSLFNSQEKPSYTARRLSNGMWMETHNSALMIDGSQRVEIVHKNKLVVAVEKTPYPQVFCKIDDWLGGVMGRCVGSGEASVMDCVSADDDIKLGCAICYESVYGEYYTEYIKKGAEVMTIITNDAWWKDTPGYRQHLSYASLRAIETRRSIARCANTGISAFIDQRGVITESTGWWKQDILSGSVNRNREMTYFVIHGDIAGRTCTFLFVLLTLSLLVRFAAKKKD